MTIDKSRMIDARDMERLQSEIEKLKLAVLRTDGVHPNIGVRTNSPPHSYLMKNILSLYLLAILIVWMALMAIGICYGG